MRPVAGILTSIRLTRLLVAAPPSPTDRPPPDSPPCIVASAPYGMDERQETNGEQRPPRPYACQAALDTASRSIARAGVDCGPRPNDARSSHRTQSQSARHDAYHQCQIQLRWPPGPVYTVASLPGPWRTPQPDLGAGAIIAWAARAIAASRRRSGADNRGSPVSGDREHGP